MLSSKTSNDTDRIALTIKQRLDKWDKIAKTRQKEDVRLFYEQLSKSQEQMIKEFYAIEKIQFLEQWKRDRGDYLHKWYEELTSIVKNAAHTSRYVGIFIDPCFNIGSYAYKKQ